MTDPGRDEFSEPIAVRALFRLRILSDLHLEFRDWRPPEVDCDVVVLAGDIHVGTAALPWARRVFGARRAIVYVPGNHEYYGGQRDLVTGALRAAAADFGIHVLDGDEVVIDGVRFLGATLWTDFELDGRRPIDVSRAMDVARKAMPDYQIVRQRPGVPMAPGDTREVHLEQRAWLAARLAVPFAGSTVVVTHHLPRRESIHPKYAQSAINPAFATDLSALCRGPVVDLWIHGHTHESFDYETDGTRVVCNPRGYLPGEPNPGFEPGKVVALIRRSTPQPASTSSST